MEIIAIIVGVVLFLVAMLKTNTSNTPVPKRPTQEEVREFISKLQKTTAIIPTHTAPVVTDAPVSIKMLKNISKSRNPLEWFPCTRKDLPAPSHAEALIIQALNLYRVQWYREVSFSGLQVNTYSYPRYDFMLVLPSTPTGIHILEYDGKLSHSIPDRLAIDKLKDRFCNKYNVPITRYSSRHYYKLHEEIAILMKQYNIPPKVQ